jgi:hypothetical protein
MCVIPQTLPDPEIDALRPVQAFFFLLKSDTMKSKIEEKERIEKNLYHALLVLFAFADGNELVDMMLSNKKVMDRRYYAFTPTFLSRGDRFMNESCGSLDSPDQIILCDWYGDTGV